MKVEEKCAKCLLDRQIAKIRRDTESKDDKGYILRVKEILDNRTEEDCSPYLVYRFTQIYQELYGMPASYAKIKQEYNDLVLSMEEEIEKKIMGDGTSLKSSLAKAISYARVGNYIDFGAMDNVDRETFLKLFEQTTFSEQDEKTFELFYEECRKAKRFLLIIDNCGEIVVDKLFVRVLKKCFPELKIQVMVRGGEVLNDATIQDAIYVGMDKEAEVISNGIAAAGTIYSMLPAEAKRAVDEADVLLLKGQGNFESFSGNGWHAYYSFLCKCELFTSRFEVPQFAGMFICE